MTQQPPMAQDRQRPETGRGHYVLELCGIVTFFAVALFLVVDVYQAMANFGYLWLLPGIAVLAYLIADLLSGFVHFLADNFGSTETPIIGPNFVGAVREHHVDPQGITRHDFIDTNGNNSLACLPFMLFALFVVPIETTVLGYLFGAFSLLLFIGVFLTNQFHKWAHIEEPPSFVAWLQERGVILSQEHHDIHHESPYDTYYCITAGVWNPLLDRLRFFERTERLLRRVTPGTHPQLRAEREGNLNDA